MSVHYRLKPFSDPLTHAGVLGFEKTAAGLCIIIPPWKEMPIGLGRSSEKAQDMHTCELAHTAAPIKPKLVIKKSGIFNGVQLYDLFE